jgi:hypothetical protein
MELLTDLPGSCLAMDRHRREDNAEAYVVHRVRRGLTPARTASRDTAYVTCSGGGEGVALADASRWRLFVSYGRRDAAEFVDRLVASLDSHGFEVWRDTLRIEPGSDWHAAISNGIDRCDVVLAVLTPHAVRRAGGGDADGVCLDELAYARQRKPVVPIRILDCEIPLSISRLSVIDARHWQRSEEDYAACVQSVLKGIGAANVQADSLYRRDPHLDRLDQSEYLHERRAGFVGRDWLFSWTLDWLRDTQGQRAALITGDPGIGKSAFLAEFAHQNPENRVIAYHACTREDRISLESGQFVNNLAAMLDERLPGYSAVLDDPGVRRALDSAHSYPGRAMDLAVVGPLNRITHPDVTPSVILVDALDEALLIADHGSVTDDATIVGLLASRVDRLPPWIRLLATARRDSRTVEQLNGQRAMNLDAHTQENRSDLKCYLADRVSDPFYEPVLRTADGNFLYAKLLVRDIGSGRVAADQLDAPPSGMPGYYARTFRQLFPREADAEATRNVLEVLVAAQAPLERGLLVASAGGDIYRTTTTLNRLAALLSERDSGFILYHRSLADWLGDPRNAFYADPARGHESLASVFVAQLDIGVERRTDPLLGGDYLPRYGIDHLSLTHRSVEPTWNPWLFAECVLASRTIGHGVGNETCYVPRFAQRYVTRALEDGDVGALAKLVRLLALAARTRYHEAGVIVLEVSPDGTSTSILVGDTEKVTECHQGLAISGWAGAVVNAVVTSRPDLAPELGALTEPADLAGLAYIAGGFDVALWAGPGSIEYRGAALSDELRALSAVGQDWTEDADSTLRSLRTSAAGLYAAFRTLSRSQAEIQQRATVLNLPQFPS